MSIILHFGLRKPAATVRVLGDEGFTINMCKATVGDFGKVAVSRWRLGRLIFV